MAIKTKAIVQGTVARISQRSGKNDKGPWSMTNVLVIGDNTLADCTLGKDVATPTHGEFITALVEIDVFRDDDNVTLIEYVEVLGKKAS